MLQYKIRTDVKQRYNSKVKIESILKEKTQSRTKSLQKRKLIVYRKSEKFYIDYSAAYALKLVSVIAIMLNDLQLFEIDLDTLENFQNNNELEIEYKEIEQDQEINVAKDELEEVLEELKSSGDYGIGVHGIDSGTILEKENIAQKISEEGLNIRNNSKTILSTSISLGTNEDSKRLSQDIREYRFGNGEKVSVVIAVPLSIKSKNGDKIFLGFPEENRRTASQQYEEHCILDRIYFRILL